MSLLFRVEFASCAITHIDLEEFVAKGFGGIY